MMEVNDIDDYCDACAADSRKFSTDVVRVRIRPNGRGIDLCPKHVDELMRLLIVHRLGVK